MVSDRFRQQGIREALALLLPCLLTSSTGDITGHSAAWKISILSSLGIRGPSKERSAKRQHSAARAGPRRALAVCCPGGSHIAVESRLRFRWDCPHLPGRGDWPPPHPCSWVGVHSN